MAKGGMTFQVGGMEGQRLGVERGQCIGGTAWLKTRVKVKGRPMLMRDHNSKWMCSQPVRSP